MASQAEVDALVALCVAGEYDQAAAMMRVSWPSLFFGGIGAVFTAGEDVGNTIRNGAGAPGGGVGVNGDFYIDTTAKAIYGPKTGGVWGSATSLIGPTPTGAANLVLATPNGSSGTASLRALVATDIPEIPTTKGGTGVGTLAAHGVLIGNGAGDVVVSGAGSATQVLTSNGASADPTFQAIPTLNQNTTGTAAALSGTNDVAHGGTGAATLAAHGVVVGNGTGAVAVTGAGTTGQVLTSNGASADPTFQTPAVDAAAGTGSLRTLGTGAAQAAAGNHAHGVATGGTGVAVLAAHGLVVGNGTSGVNVTGAGTAGQVLVSGGASADPAFAAIPSHVHSGADVDAATTSQRGAVELANDGEYAASVAVQGNDSRIPVYFRKASTQTFSGLAPDDDFIYTVPAIGFYEFEVLASVTANATNGFHAEISGGTATIGVVGHSLWQVFGETSEVATGSFYGILEVSCTGFVDAALSFKALLSFSGTGTFRLSFNTSTGSGTVDLLIGSVMKVQRVF